MIREKAGIAAQRLHAYWLLRTRKEQSVLIALMALCFAGTLYALLLRPAYAYYNAAKVQYQKEKDLAAWLEQTAPHVKQITSEQTRSDQSLISVVTALSQQHSVPLLRIEPSEQAMTVWLDQTEFQQVIALLLILKGEEGVLTYEVSVESAGAPQMAKTKAKLRWAE